MTTARIRRPSAASVSRLVRGAWCAVRRETLVTLLLAACATGGVRPRFGPEPQAVMMLLDLPASVVTESLTTSLVRVGLPVRTSEPREGYLESVWFDVAAHRPTGDPFSRLDSIVKLRFFADPAFGHTRLFAECVVRVAWDPSVPQRDLERMPPAGHPGRVLLDSVLTVMTRHVVR